MKPDNSGSGIRAMKDDSVKVSQDTSFEDAAGPLSRLVLSYLSPLFRLGSTRALQLEDLGPLSKGDIASEQYGKFAKAWAEKVPDRVVGWKLGRYFNCVQKLVRVCIRNH